MHRPPSPERARCVPAAALAAALLLAACSDGERRAPRAAAPLDCAVPPATAAWAGPFTEERALREDAEPAFGSIAGLSVGAGGVFALDAANDAVLLLDDSLHRSGAFGRGGKGPGELDAGASAAFPAPGGFKDWVAASGDSLVVYDGSRVSLFDRRGTFRRYLVQEPREVGISPALHRIRLVGGELLYGAGGHDPMSWSKDQRPGHWELRGLSGSGARALLTLELRELPRYGGVPFAGPDEAQPVWDANGACAVASDGSAPVVVVRALTGERVDTLEVALPPAPSTDTDPQLRELMKEMGANRGPVPRATAPMRVRDVAIAPDGRIWLLLRATARPDDSPAEVLVVDPRTRESRRDTLPAFPRAFGEAGTYFAVIRDGDGLQRIARVAAGAAGGGGATPP